MPMLRREPPRQIATVADVVAIAHAMEREAAARYGELAERMRRAGNPALAELFERLAADERGHAEGLVRWSERDLGGPPDPSRVRWDLSDTFDDEGTGAASPALVTAYRALSMAVRNEERAFAFWSYVAANAAFPQVREAAEDIAWEKLGDIATLRRERRRAYHAERAGAAQAAPAALGRDSLGQLETRLGEMLDRLAAAEPAAAARLGEAAREARARATDLAWEPLAEPDRPRSAVAVPDDPLALAELLVDRYLAVADATQSEANLARAQRLAAGAITRLAWLRDHAAATKG